jgi:hypothetical protein
MTSCVCRRESLSKHSKCGKHTSATLKQGQRNNARNVNQLSHSKPWRTSVAAVRTATSTHLHAFPLRKTMLTEGTERNRHAVPQQRADQAGEPEAKCECASTRMLAPVGFRSRAGIIRLTRSSAVGITSCSYPARQPQPTGSQATAAMLAVIIDARRTLLGDHSGEIAL